MPLPEIISKDLKHLFKSILNFIINGFKTKNIFIYPEYPSKGSVIYKIANNLNYNISNKELKNSKIALFWENTTFRKEFKYLEQISNKVKVINLYNRNISKEYVDEAFGNVFNYSTIINPLEYEGYCVKKSIINAMHDGEILKCPLTSIEKDFVYQILIDNTFDKETVLDIRVPIFNKTIDFVYLKYRKIDERFKNTTTKAVICNINDVLTKDEIEKINKFSAEIKLDYGELDVLRDNLSGKIYIIDVNNTPYGPPSSMTKKQKREVIEKLSSVFRDMFLN